MINHLILDVAVPTPLRRSFYYLLPDHISADAVSIGARVAISFGRQQLIGIICGTFSGTDIDVSKLKAIDSLIDEEPALPGVLLPLMQWAANYYHHPIGESLAAALPNALRKGQALPSNQQTVWQLIDTSFTSDALPSNAKQQRKLIDHLVTHDSINAEQLKSLGITGSTVKALIQRNLIEEAQETITVQPAIIHPSPLALNDEQKEVMTHYQQIADSFSICLLEGVTGSGKTEVYLQAIAHALSQGKQALILVPEIGLTPQTIERFQQRFSCPMAIFHSSLTDLQRLKYWQQARDGIAHIIIGTRSALFTATKNLGVIVVDEEHDLSYKQQDGLRYSARDLACIRAKLENIPIILGSATPTLETLNNAVMGKYLHWKLKQRAGDAQAAKVDIIDIRKQRIDNGIAESVLPELKTTLDKGEQALLFINRRGFSPSLICHDCGFVSLCPACDTRLTVHQQSQQLRCHHCGVSERTPTKCPQCFSMQMIRTGTGTERLELALQQYFPNTPLFRIDRDTTRQKNALENMVEQIHQHEAALLIGTQMLAKGHHFPNVTLVVVIDADHSLVSTDYRAIERFGQLITQVTGRAGREQKVGRALIQSHYPQHPQLIRLINWGYHRFAMDLLAQRKQLQLPPFSYQALIRLEDKQAAVAESSLEALKQSLRGLPCTCIGPMPASLQRRAYFYRYQLLIQSPTRQQLHQTVQHLLKSSETLIKSHRQRWSIDIDPQDMS